MFQFNATASVHHRFILHLLLLVICSLIHFFFYTFTGLNSMSLERVTCMRREHISANCILKKMAANMRK